MVVADDGSTDQRRLDELERLLPESALARQGNAGVASARNTALERIQTPCTLLVAADDLLPPRASTHLRKPFERDPSLGFSYCRMHFFGDWEYWVDAPARGWLEVR